MGPGPTPAPGKGRLLRRLTATAALCLIGFQAQRTTEPKSAGAPDNLFAPLPGFDRAEGSFVRQARALSVSRVLQRRGAVFLALAGTALGLAWVSRRRGAG